jgi:3-oxoacyl-[acyl-carrier protein] reductase
MIRQPVRVIKTNVLLNGWRIRTRQRHDFSSHRDALPSFSCRPLVRYLRQDDFPCALTQSGFALMLLEGKKALITGGSRGIGRSLCRVFAREGADVAFCYAANEEAATETRAEIESHGRQGLSIRADVGDRAASLAMVDEVISRFGRIDILVHNAGINRGSLFLRMPDEHWDEIVQTNINGLYNVGKPVFQQMMKQRGGNMLAITSISGIRSVPAGVPYAMSKAAMIGFTKAIAREGGRLGIRSNAIAVGVVETDLAGTIPQHFLDAYKDWAAMDRFGHPDETAELAAFMVSDRNSYMTGEVVVQDGGVVV